MKILILTQKIDKNDSVLGFFHRWVQEFAERTEQVTVICLYKGEYDLPDNVRVLSLGKENGVSRIKYIINFYKYIFIERKNYDSVFVHMNQEYVILGGLLWRFWGKKVLLWYNHAKGSWLTRLAVLFSNKVFCTSPQSFTAQFDKTKIMPVGVDTDFFKPDSTIDKKSNSILLLGRIAPVKNVDIFIDALKQLKDEGVNLSVTIAGGSIDRDRGYENMIREKVVTYGLSSNIVFTGSISQIEARDIYLKHELYVNLTSSGSLDKTIFEATASGLKVLAYNTFLSDRFPEGWVVEENNLDKLVSGIKSILFQPYDESIQKKISKFIPKHSLNTLMKEMIYEFNSLKI